MSPHGLLGLLPQRFTAHLRGGIALGVLLGATVGCTSFDRWQRHAIFQDREVVVSEATRAPDPAEEFELPVGQGDRIHAWFVPALAAAAPTVLFLHGARHDLNGCAPRVTFWRNLGFNVLAVDYRGFGRSTARVPSEASAIEDAQAALAELRRRQPDASHRFIYGYSLGGALAIALAAQAPRGEIAGVMIESSFTRIADVVSESFGRGLPLPTAWITQPFDSLRRIALVQVPLLFIHGTADTLVPHTMSDRLMAAAVQVPATSKQVLKIEGASHRSGYQLGGQRYADAVDRFVGSATALAQHGAGPQRLARPHGAVIGPTSLVSPGPSRPWPLKPPTATGILIAFD